MWYKNLIIIKMGYSQGGNNDTIPPRRFDSNAEYFFLQYSDNIVITNNKNI